MEDKETREFSLTWLFLVTGFCFVVFRYLLRMLDGTNLPLFTWIGLACIIMGIFFALSTTPVKTAKKNTPH